MRRAISAGRRVNLPGAFVPLSFLIPQLFEAEIDHDPRHPRDEAGVALKLFQALPAFRPRPLRKIERLLFVPHHAESTRVNHFPMTHLQFVE